MREITHLHRMVHGDDRTVHMTSFPVSLNYFVGAICTVHLFFRCSCLSAQKILVKGMDLQLEQKIIAFKNCAACFMTVCSAGM